jgi:hypothetical protein
LRAVGKSACFPAGALVAATAGEDAEARAGAAASSMAVARTPAEMDLELRNIRLRFRG